MTRIEMTEKACRDCGADLLYDNATQVFGCEDCKEAWSKESLDDWPEHSMPPETPLEYNEYF